MRRLQIFLLLTAACMVPGLGQSFKADAFGGFTYFRGDRDLVSGTANSAALMGWQGAFTYKVTDRFGLTAAATGDYGNVRTTSNSSRSLPIHTVMGGPQITVLKLGSLEIFGRALAGTVLTGGLLSRTGNRFQSGGDTAFAAALGGGADFNITRRIAWRIVQPEWVLTRIGTSTQSSLQASTGIVVRFGR